MSIYLKKNPVSLRYLLLVAFTTLPFAGLVTAASDQAALMKQARVSKAAAEKTALAKVPTGKIKSEEIEREHGKLIWSFDIAKPGTKNITEIQVDAISGKIVRTEIENPKAQTKEAAADKAAKK